MKDHLEDKNGSGATEGSNPLGPYLDTPIRLFIADSILLRQTAMVLTKLGFNQVSINRVDPNYFQAIRQLFSELMNFDGVLLVNHPPQKITSVDGETYHDLNFQDFYGGVATLVNNTHGRPKELLAKCIPLFVAPLDSDIRSRIVNELFPFGIMGVFMLQAQHRKIAADRLIEERTQELHFYFLEYFMHKNQKMTQFREFKTAQDLRARRAESELLMNEVTKLKAAKDFDRAIALCRKVIDLMPEDPEAYLEGGRLLVRKRKYVPALQMFRDAEAVAEDLPTPNQEIAQMRVDQAKDYVLQARADGREPDPNKINIWLQEAVDNFKSAVEKAETIKTVDPGDEKERRKEAVVGIADTILNLGLSGAIPEKNKFFLEMVGLAQETLQKQSADGEKISPEYLTQFAMVAFYEGNYDKALADLLKAAQDPKCFLPACTKLNHIGTQLRQRGNIDKAIAVYTKLLDLSPPFKGVVLFNLSVAYQAKAYQLRPSGDPQCAALDVASLGTAVEALFLDPQLMGQDGFYQNTVIAPILAKGMKLIRIAAQQAEAGGDPTDRDCLLARERLEAILASGSEGRAIQELFNLAKALPDFFLKFDRHVSKPVLAFTERLHNVLLKRPEPRMQTMGKICGVLVQKGTRSQGRQAVPVDPALEPCLRSLEEGEEPRAARELVQTLMKTPQLLKNGTIGGNETVAGLCREVDLVLGRLELPRFGVPGLV